MTAAPGIFVNAQARATIEPWFDRFAARIQRPMVSRKVPTRRGENHVLVGGPENGPPLVILHGALASSAHAMGELWPLLNHHRVYAVDVIGQSPRAPEVRPSLKGPDYGEWLTDVFDGLKLPQAHLLGVSWGGFVAMKMAAVAPARIDHLALLVPAGLAGGSAIDGMLKIGWPMWRYQRDPTEEKLRAFVTPMLSNWDEDWARYLGDAIRSYRLDMRVPPIYGKAELAPFTGPALVLAADADLSFPGAKVVTQAKKVLANLVESDVLPNCRHCPPTTDVFRKTLCDRVGKFLAN